MEVNQATITVERIGDTETFGANGFRKRELVGMTDEGEYAQPLLFEFVQDNVSLLDAVAEGQNVTISYNLKGKRWSPEGKKERIFVALQGWKIENANADSSANANQAPQKNNDADPDDLPF